MREIGINDARPILGDLVTAVEQGDEIVLTRRGRPAARIVPYVDRAAVDPDHECSAAEVDP